MTQRLIKLWDWPVRITHWLLVLCVLGCYGTAEWGWLTMQWHFYFGYAIIVLTLTRVVWGFFGSEQARFGNFVRGPRAVLAYLKGQAPARIGHNPLGAVAVLGLLSALLIQATTGLFHSDDALWFGPLNERVSADLRELMGDWHERFYWVLFALIALHLAAIIYYTVRKKNLLGPMLTGRKAHDTALDERQKPAWQAVIWLALVATIFWATLQYWPG
jgi:cytochrome b